MVLYLSFPELEALQIVEHLRQVEELRDQLSNVGCT